MPPTHHHHHHGDHDHADIGEKNRSHFNDVAGHIFDVPWIAKLAHQIHDELHQQIDWIGHLQHIPGRQTQMLDYACGDGLASRALAPYFSTIRGMDISEGMAKQYNLKAKEAGYSAAKMHAVAGDLVSDPASVDSTLTNFDLIVMSMALHHVEDPRLMIQRLSERLAHGGALLIVDWVAPTESGCSPIVAPTDSPVMHTVARMGFEQKELDDWFKSAKLGESGWKWFSKRSELPSELGGEKQLFLAKAVKESRSSDS